MIRIAIVTTALQGAFAAHDWLRWHWLLLVSWVRSVRAGTPSTNTPLHLAYQAVADASDTMEAVHEALTAQDYDQAKRLLELGHDSLIEHQSHLKGLM